MAVTLMCVRHGQALRRAGAGDRPPALNASATSIVEVEVVDASTQPIVSNWRNRARTAPRRAAPRAAGGAGGRSGAARCRPGPGPWRRPTSSSVRTPNGSSRNALRPRTGNRSRGSSRASSRRRLEHASRRPSASCRSTRSRSGARRGAPPRASCPRRAPGRIGARRGIGGVGEEVVAILLDRDAERRGPAGSPTSSPSRVDRQARPRSAR